jgi:hypothetical protein
MIYYSGLRATARARRGYMMDDIVARVTIVLEPALTAFFMNEGVFRETGRDPSLWAGQVRSY